jgi:hypothetical protein
MQATSLETPQRGPGRHHTYIVLFVPVVIAVHCEVLFTFDNICWVQSTAWPQAPTPRRGRRQELSSAGHQRPSCLTSCGPSQPGQAGQGFYAYMAGLTDSRRLRRRGHGLAVLAEQTILSTQLYRTGGETSLLVYTRLDGQRHAARV